MTLQEIDDEIAARKAMIRKCKDEVRTLKSLRPGAKAAAKAAAITPIESTEAPPADA